MAQKSLQELLGNLLDTQSERMENVREGRAPSSAWDGPPLPLENEYRVVVDTSVYAPSKSSGRNQFVITFEITEPEEHAGRKIQTYYSPEPANEWASQALADLFGALKADMEQGWGEDFDAFAAQFVGQTAVITLKPWDDRYSLRWINADRGQTLKTDIKPPKEYGGAKGKADLKADIVVPKSPDPQAPSTAVTPPTATPPLPGVNLPPALRG